MDEVFRLFPIPFMRARATLPLALLTFNVGVEIGQLLMVGAVLVVVRLPLPERWFAVARRPALYGIGVLAAYWSWQRVAAIVF